MLYALTLGLLLSHYPVKPDLSANFTGIMVPRAINMAKLLGISIELPSWVGKLEWRIGKLRIELRGKIVYASLEALQTHTDSAKDEPIRWIKLYLNRHTGAFYAKSEMLGGIVEAEGVLPK